MSTFRPGPAEILRLSFILILPLVTGSCTYRFYSAGCDMPAPGNLVRHCVLDNRVRESSGLLYLDGRIWTFNDSGGEAALYCLDPSSGELIRSLRVEGARNVDWEDMCMDSSFVYIADVGNNFATRDTVEIYRISLETLRGTDTLVACDGIISLSFREQVERNPRGLSSLDCEAILVQGDSPFLFTKDWVHQTTTVYALPAIPGYHEPTALRSYEARLLVSGADIDGSTGRVALLGYRNFMPVLIIYAYDRSPAEINCGGRGRIYPLKAGRQTEGICFDNRGFLFISSERSLKKQGLFRMGAELR